jgi:cytochrome c
MVLDSFELNKIVASLLVGLLLYMVISITAESFFHVEAPATTAYAVAVPEAAAVAEEEDAALEPSLAALLAGASTTRGARVFRRCQACHTAESGGGNRVGPALWNVVGNDIASHADYGYSAALGDAPGNWDFEALDAYLASPSAALPGNKMGFAGLRNPQERADVIAYLREASDNPVELPAYEAPAEVAAEEGGEG